MSETVLYELRGPLREMFDSAVLNPNTELPIQRLHLSGHIGGFVAAASNCPAMRCPVASPYNETCG